MSELGTMSGVVMPRRWLQSISPGLVAMWKETVYTPREVSRSQSQRGAEEGLPVF